MSGAVRPEVQTFLDSFFAKPNRLTPARKPEIAQWVARLSSQEPLATVLPCWREEKVVDWYGIAFNDREFRALGEGLTAFVGPSYTTFRGQLAKLDDCDPIDKAVFDLAGERVFKFSGEDPAEIWRALQRMRNVWARRGSREMDAPVQVGRVLRDFYMALRARERAAAEGTLTLLRERYHLDGVNALYLRVQLLDAFCGWSELLHLRELPELLRLRRPAAVSEALIRAVYHEHLARLEAADDPCGAADAFRRDVLPRFGNLFNSRAGMHCSEAARSFMLLAVTKVPPDLLLRDELLARVDLDPAGRAYIQRLGALAPECATKPPEGDPLDLALEAVRASEFDRAFSLASDAPASAARAKLLCECALELGTIRSFAAAVTAVNAMGEEERAAFLRRRVNQALWEDLRTGAAEGVDAAEGEAVPSDWCSWLEHLDRNEGRSGAREIARRGATEWPVEGLLGSPGALERLSGRLQANRSQAAEVALRDSLPHLLTFLARDPTWPNPALKTVYRSLLEILYYSTDGGRSDLIVFSELAEAMLALGAVTTEYRELVSFARELWARFAAPATLDWAADVIEILVEQPCPDAEARRSFLQEVLDRAAGFSRHLTADQRELLRLSAADLGAIDLASTYFPTDPGPSGDEIDPLIALGGKSVAVYTLTVRSAEQFRRVVEGRGSGVSVTLLHDLGASKRLEQYARQADIFVLVTASAKHAATDFIRARRPAGKPLLFPAGKGTASMLAAVRTHVERGG
jgi:hypothetical protein